MKLNEYETKCLDNAETFTAVRGFGARRTREDFASLADAEKYAAGFGDGRTMLYAVTRDGMSAHIANA